MDCDGRPGETTAARDRQGSCDGATCVRDYCAQLRADPRVPRRAKIAVVIALLWVLSPIDLVPEFLPIIGPLDDVIVVAIAFRYAAGRVPRDVLFEAWPAEPRILERLIPAKGKGD